MEKRVILAMLLSLIVLLTYQILLGPPPAPQPPPGAPQEVAPGAKPEPGKAPATSPAPAPAAPPTAPAAPAAALVVGDTAAHDVVVDADAFVATFTTAGGALKNWRLKSYLHAGEPLDLVPQDVAPGQYPPTFT